MENAQSIREKVLTGRTGTLDFCVIAVKRGNGARRARAAIWEAADPNPTAMVFVTRPRFRVSAGLMGWRPANVSAGFLTGRGVSVLSQRALGASCSGRAPSSHGGGHRFNPVAPSSVFLRISTCYGWSRLSKMPRQARRVTQKACGRV